MDAHVPLNYIQSLLHGFVAGQLHSSSGIEEPVPSAQSEVNKYPATANEFMDCVRPNRSSLSAGHTFLAYDSAACALAALRRIARRSSEDPDPAKSALLPDCEDGGATLVASFLLRAQLYES